MPDFTKVLAKLRTDDLKLLLPREGVFTATTRTAVSESPTRTSRRRRRKTNADTTAPDKTVAVMNEAPLTAASAGEPATPVAKPIEPEDPSATAGQTDPLVALSSQEHPLPAYEPKGDATDEPQKRARQAVAHEWPVVGTKLSATYFGETYTAEIVSARKKLKSGRQVRLLDGPSKGRICDSLSEAMLLATARQRRQQKLGRKGTANGWRFWCWTGKAESPTVNTSSS